MAGRERIFMIGPPKPVSQMTDAEYDAWVDAIIRLHGPVVPPDPSPDPTPGNDH